MDSTQYRAAAHAAVDHIADYYDTVEQRRVISAVQPGYLKELLPDGPPADGEPWSQIQNDIDSKIMPGLTHWQSPNFMAFYPCNSSFPGMLGEMYSAAFNGPMFNWICSPAATELETIVLDWLAVVFNLPTCFHSNSQGGGVIQGSASEAIVTVMIAARDRFLRESVADITDEKLRDEAFYARRTNLVALGSETAHSSTQKAAQIAGVRFRSIPVKAENGFSLTGAEVTQAIAQCHSEGLQPFYLTITLGTTNTCAVDDFASIAAVTQKHASLWTHVDAAYAGAALVCPEYHHLTAHFAAFDSYDVNLHKWLLVNFDASCLFVKNRRHLTDTFSITPPYLRNAQSDSGLVTDYRDWQIPLGRRFRSLKIWFVLRTYGVKGLQSYIRNHIDLGSKFAAWVAKRTDLFTIFTKPVFALTVLTVRPQAVASDKATPDEQLATNEMTREVYEKINTEGKIMLTSSLVDGSYVIRVVSASPQTDEAHLKKAFDVLVRTAEDVRNGRTK